MLEPTWKDSRVFMWFYDALKNAWSNKIKTYLFPIQRDPDRGITLDVAQKEVSHFLIMIVLSPSSEIWGCHYESPSVS